jgi:hypothetical protein
VNYRFPEWKDANWNSYKRQSERYKIIKGYLGRDSVGAEIGVYKGGFAEFLLGHCKKLYLVDSWYRSGGYWQTGIPNDSRVDALINILKIHRDEIHSGQIIPVVDDSLNFLKSIKDRYFDFLYIDASHKYETTKHELEIAVNKVKPGGHILGDDYDPDPNSKQYGVYRAVNEFVTEQRAELVLDKGRQWGVRV